MRFRISAVAAGALGAALAVAGCGSTGNVSSSTPTSTAAGASAVSFGSANQQLCGAANTKPGYQNTTGTISGGAKTLTGAGSTFVAPMMSDWTKTYNTSTGVQVTYSSIGSGGGVKQVQANTVNFGASDTGMKASEIAAAKGGPVLQIPLLLGGVVPAYNLQGIASGLKFTGNVLGEIYAGKIKEWNDPALTALNPGAKLPAEAIAVVHRSDGSGTTGIWTDYLTKTSPTWVSALGGAEQSKGKTVAWPVGIGAKGNEGVSGAIGQTQGALGYVEAAYAISQQLTYGQVQNKSGTFIQPCIASFVPAVNGVTFPANLNISLTDGSDPHVYPITGTTYGLVYEHQTSQANAAALVNFFGWVLSSGQDLNASLSYAPLGPDLQKLSVAQLKKITVNGQPVVK